ncbi:MAG: glycosyltransferase family 39 protein [Nanoarchaeota archaeon]|nr:glycosyltransferase family 39 protein [Nanoarchaeota archaeon]
MEEIIAIKSEEKIIEERKKTIKTKLFSWVQDNYDKAFIGVLILAFVIRVVVFFITKDQAMWFDGAEYMSTAKLWAGVGNMTDLWYYRRGALWPLFGALFFKIGLGEVGIRFSEVLFSTGIIAVSYFLVRDMFNKKYALFTAIGLTFSWVAFFFTGRTMTDIPSTFFILLTLFLFWKGYEMEKGKKYLYLSGLFLAVSVLIRMQNLMVLPMFFVLAFIKEKFKFLKNKSLWITLLIFALALVPHFIVYAKHFGNPLIDILSYDLGIIKTAAAPVARTSVVNWPIYFLDLPYNLTLPIFILFIIGAVYFFADLFLGFDKIFKNKTIQSKLFVFLWIALPLLVLGYMQMDPTAQQRYTLMQHPFLFMIAAIPLFELGKLVEKHLKINKKVIAILILIILVASLIPNLVWGYQLTESKKSSYYELKLAGEWIKQHSNIDDTIITQSFPQISYYSERRTGTFDDGFKNPESHSGDYFNETSFDEFVNKEKPKFLILSIFQKHDDWMVNYPMVHNDTWFPVQGYQQDNQPILVIYQANYN